MNTLTSATVCRRLLMACILVINCSMAIADEITPDSLEGYNRKMFLINRHLDKTILRPIAKAYDYLLPNFVLKGIHNFFSNLQDVPTLLNEALQFKLYNALSDFWRIGVNTTVGFGGFIDVSSEIGLEKHYEDLGLTFARYGWTNSRYLVIPIYGASTIRDAIALPLNFKFLSVYPHIRDAAVEWSLVGLDFIDERRTYLDSDHLIDEALDPYVFVRDAYLQKRANYINPQSDQGEEIYNEAMEDNSQKSS